MWAKIVDGAVAAYPYGVRELREENPNTSFPEEISTELLESFGIVVVVPHYPPAFDYRTHDCNRVSPALQDGEWHETWLLTAAAPEVVEARKLEVRQTMRLSFAQLVTGLVAEGWITEAEGDAWLQNVLPATVLALISTLPVEQRFAARARASRPSEIDRMNSLVQGLAVLRGKTPDELDQFFITWREF